MKTILTVVGARPQFIKAAMLSRVVSQEAEITEILLHTGQHYDFGMSESFFEELGIPAPAFNLGIGGGGQGQMTGRQLEQIEAILDETRPDCVLVYGDTNSTLAGALAAAKLHVPVAHVEAGLRSGNKRMPEEINRILTDHVSAFLFTPTLAANQNLAKEGLAQSVYFVGDIMYDAAKTFAVDLQSDGSPLFSELALTNKRYRVATVHRQENVDDQERLGIILSALRSLAKEMPLILPIHPRLRKTLEHSKRGAEMLKGITVIDPVGFKDMIALLREASLVITDSGGLQKEAYFHGTPAIVLREETEWTELTDLGWALLAPPISTDHILVSARKIEGTTGDEKAQPYGAGDTAARIMQILKDNL